MVGTEKVLNGSIRVLRDIYNLQSSAFSLNTWVVTLIPVIAICLWDLIFL